MKKTTVILLQNKRESGVALIYALALLGLLLVMLLGYLSSSILEQRIAYNQSSQVGANLLAKSALIKLKAQLATYADASVWMQYRSQTNKLIAPLVSIDADNSKSLGSNKQNATEAYQELKPLLDKFGMTHNFFPASTQMDFPEWINYYVSDGKSDNRRLTGRIAYAVVPNLGIDPAQFRIYYQGLQLGQEQNELAPTFDFINKLGATRLKDTKNNWLSIDLLAGKSGLWAKNTAGNGAYIYSDEAKDEFFDSTSAAVNSKFLCNYYFTANQPTVKDRLCPPVDDPIIASDTSDTYDRYNLGNGSKLYIDHTSTAAGTMVTLVDELSTGVLAHTASGTQRYQIAANLIDYIDPDSKPTSDVDSSLWLTETPTYTGNERTLYINQIALATYGKYVYTVAIKYSQDGTQAQVTQTIRCTFSGYAWPELINQYAMPMHARLTLKDVDMHLNVSAKYNDEELTPTYFAHTGSSVWDNSVKLNHEGSNTLYKGWYVTAQSYLSPQYAGGIYFNTASVNFQKISTVEVDAGGHANITPIKLKITVNKMGFERALLQPTVNGAYASWYSDYVSGMNTDSAVLLDAALGDTAETKYASAYANFEAYDPRYNLSPAEWTKTAHVEAGCDLSGIYAKIPNLGKKNDASKSIKNTTNTNQDFEPDDDPVKVSTAYIRNGWMQSLWELGFIHRGARFQTINLKSALNPLDSPSDSDLQSYRNDAQLLDRVTLHQDTVEKLKKYNINQPSQNVAAYAPLTGAHWKGSDKVGAFYFNPVQRINYGTYFVPYLPSNPELSYNEMKSLQTMMAEKRYGTGVNDKYRRYIHRGMLANAIMNWEMNGTSPYTNSNCRRDAQMEELIGKIVPLTRCGDIYEDFTVFAVAETIKDVGSTKGDKYIVKYDRNGKGHRQKCEYGKIDDKDDVGNDFMFDEITGKSYLVARLRREIVECQNTENCQNGIHEPECKFKIKVLESFVLNDL